MAAPSGVDPHEVLGVATGAPLAEVTAAYRRLAKRWHPDRAPSAESADRMALINAAYDALRTDGGATGRGGRTASGAPPGGTPGGGPPSWPHPGSGPGGAARTDPDDPLRGRRSPADADRRADDPGEAPAGAGPGGWAAGVFPVGGPPPVPGGDGVPAAVGRALGAELRSALQPGEEVGIVVPATTWASPQTTLAVTDRRVLWLLDDAPVHRVRALLLSDVRAVRVRDPRPWRPGAQVACTDRRGRRTTFGGLPPATAAAVARRIRR